MKATKKYFLEIILITILSLIIFYYSSGNSIFYNNIYKSNIDISSNTPEIKNGDQITQRMYFNVDAIERMDISLENDISHYIGNFNLKIVDTNQETIYQDVIDLRTGENNKLSLIKNTLLVNKGELYTIVLIANFSCDYIRLNTGSKNNTLRGTLKLEFNDKEKLLINNKVLDEKLHVEFWGKEYHLLGPYYLVFSAILLFIVLIIYIRVLYCLKNSKNNWILNFIYNFKRYNFLIKQMISRDFKTKYRRSILGVFWSVLNPLLTMVVQYLVFSRIFKSGISNFSLYLLSGIVVFNYFSEVTSMSLTSIVSNDNLIKKVYIPKYIFPVTRSLSSTVNLLIAFIPLFIFVIITGAPITISMLLLPLGLIYLYFCTLGFSFILATLMVFFRDVQFLWGILIMLWMYLTPIFYPVSIIPNFIFKFYQFNPLYQIIRFFRSILIYGIAPTPIMHFACIVSAIVPLFIGVIFFNKNQDKFILYI